MHCNVKSAKSAIAAWNLKRHIPTIPTIFRRQPIVWHGPPLFRFGCATLSPISHSNRLSLTLRVGQRLHRQCHCSRSSSREGLKFGKSWYFYVGISDENSTYYSEIQWEEGKSVQGSFFLTIIGATYAVAVNSSWKNEWPHQSEYWLSISDQN